MQEHHNSFQELLNLISVKYPLVGISISFGTMILGIFLPDIHRSIWDIEIPKIVMQLFQLSFGVGGFLIAFFTFRRNKKNKNK